MTKSIVVVHGVGSPELGSEIKKIADAVDDQNSAMQISSIRSNETDVPAGELIHKGGTVRLYELNWSHIVRPAHNVWNTLVQLFCLVFAAAQIAQAGWGGQNSYDANSVDAPSRIGLCYRWVLAAVTIWAPILAATIILAEILKENYKPAATLIVLGIGAAVFSTARMLRKVDTLASKCGLLWACAITLLGLLVALGGADRETLYPISHFAVFVGIYGSGTLLLIGIAESFWRGRFARRTLRASSFRAATFVIPFIVLAAAWGPVVFTAQFMVVDIFVAIDKSILTKAKVVYDQVVITLPYDIVKLELINFVAFFIAVIALVVFFLIWNSALGSKFAETQDWGSQFRKAVAIWLLLIILIGLVTIVPVIFETIRYFSSEAPAKNDEKLSGAILRLVNLFRPAASEDPSLLEIYRASMWRVSAVLLLLIPMFAQMIVVFLQIIFYICPIWSPISTKTELLRQFENVTNLAMQQGGEAPIILAYSQGSKIAADALAVSKTPIDRLVTIGSPVDAIHGSFLEMPVPEHGVTWLNFYRNSDFIGGAIHGEQVENSLIETNFTSTHFRYYREMSVLKAVGLA